MTWNKSDILNLINTNDNAVTRGLVRIYERQTQDEQSSESTNHLNGRGFNGRDAAFGSSLAKQIIAWNTNKRYPTPLTRNQLEMGRKMLRKYAGQLARVANELQNDESQAEAKAELDYERYLETQNELAYMRAVTKIK